MLFQQIPLFHSKKLYPSNKKMMFPSIFRIKARLSFVNKCYLCNDFLSAQPSWLISNPGKLPL
jgi:hypothetical protein